ncbi:MAG: thymidylate kinase [Spirochaetes bacterium]|nr:thymidylate kinase [Spirochaetota bacterium]
MTKKRTYKNPLPGLNPETLSGALIVIEGADCSGRSTQIRLLSEWLEQNGYAVTQVGLTRSKLIGPALARAKEGNILSPRTMSLFYATDFYDQIENTIVPALNAGYIVLADRYIYTLMARDIVRGANPEWVESLYSMAVVPDAVFFLLTSSQNLIERTLTSHQSLDYWESGMDIGLSRDWYDSFIRYQRSLRNEYKNLQVHYGFETINGNRTIGSIQKDLRAKIEAVLEKVYAG